MWYAVRTETGEEENICRLILRMADSSFYSKCFVPKKEMVWRMKGECVTHEELLLPGMVIVVTEKPEHFREELKKLPYYESKHSCDEHVFFPISKQEEEFLSSVLTEMRKNSYIIPLSPVKVDAEGEITSFGGVLALYSKQVVKKRIRNRYVIVRIPIGDRAWDVYMGIELSGDYAEGRRAV